MTTHYSDQLPVEDAPVGGLEEPGPFSASSIVDLIKQEQQELTEIKDVLIPIKGYEKAGLRVKYGMPESGKVLDNIARKVMREVKDTYSRNLFITMDTMAHLEQGLYVLPPEMALDEAVELDPEHTGMAISLTGETFAKMVGAAEGSSARDIIRKAFGGNELAIVAHGEKLNRWLQDSKADLSVEVWQMGES